MSRLQCVGKSSQFLKDAIIPLKPEGLSDGEPVSNEPVERKSRPANPRHRPKPEGRRASPTKRTDVRQAKASPNRTGAHAGPPTPSRKDVTKGTNKKTEQTPPAVKEKDTGTECEGSVCETKPTGTPCSMCVTRPDNQRQHASKTKTNQSPNEEEEGAEEEEEDEEVAECRAPLELFAEFLKAVMGRDYPLARKLCEMILIYEPENAEAGLFMPLIEEKLLMAREEEEQEGGSGSSSGDEGDDDDDDGEEDSESCDSEGEGESSDSSDSSSSSSSSSDREEEESREREHKHCWKAPLPP